MKSRRLPAYIGIISIILALATNCCLAALSEGLVAHFNFDEGSGTTVRDRTGSGNDGQIHGANWVRRGNGYALQFGRTGSYVDFGDNPDLKITGDFSFSAWLNPTADTYPDGTTNFTVFCWETYRNSGALFNISGSDGRLYFRSNQADDRFQHGYSTAPLSNRTAYHAAVIKQGDKLKLFIDGKPNAEFTVEDPSPNGLPFTLSQQSQSFSGIVDDVRIYNRAISAGEVVALYTENALQYGKDTAWVGKLKLTPFIYHEDKKAIVEANFRGVLPLEQDEKILVELQGAEGSIARLEHVSAPDSGAEDFDFDLSKLSPGKYEVRVSIVSPGKIRADASVHFDYPFSVPAPPSPSARVAGPLPTPPKTPPFSVEVGKGGGFSVIMGGESYPVESVYSYPYGGENRLAVSDAPDNSGEREWTVLTEKVSDKKYRVVAGGRYYRVTREIGLEPTRILVTDRIENLDGDDLGIALDNRIDLAGRQDAYIEAPASPWPPVFIKAGNRGLGLVPLNDVYQFLQKTYVRGSVCGSEISGLGIGKGKSHTLEWAVYPTGTADYYDFLNAVRKDEGLNGLTVDGCLAITHSGRWLRELPPDELIHNGGVDYMSSGCVTKVADDPGISFEGIEFMRYPKERESLKNNYIMIKERFPGLKVGFHVAYNIYATNQPDNLFTDSKLIARSGKHEMYGSFDGYFSKERREQGWGWYPYYPTLTNSFGKELLRSIDVMMDEIGVDMVWADGLLAGYGPAGENYPTSFVSTFEPWDGHTVELDPSTRTISRKLGQKAALGKDALVEYIRRMNAKGGRVWINHMAVAPRSFAREKAYWAAETNDGDFRCASLHLSPAPHGLANPQKTGAAQIIYDDIRSKLSWGVLYSYYWWGGSSQLTHRMITADMYPITLEELHSGCIKGLERIITMNSGVYGWRNDRHLHEVLLYDGRGRLVPRAFLSTADSSGVRTEVNLGDNETAIVKKIPVTLIADKPVNVSLIEYGAQGIGLALNGKGPVRLEIGSDSFVVKPGATYAVKDKTVKEVKVGSDGKLIVPLQLNGSTTLSIEQKGRVE